MGVTKTVTIRNDLFRFLDDEARKRQTKFSAVLNFFLDKAVKEFKNTIEMQNAEEFEREAQRELSEEKIRKKQLIYELSAELTRIREMRQELFLRGLSEENEKIKELNKREEEIKNLLAKLIANE
jgi:septal ring factor EnvC (AmiA/AmiB activator)